MNQILLCNTLAKISTISNYWGRVNITSKTVMNAFNHGTKTCTIIRTCCTYVMMYMMKCLFACTVQVGMFSLGLFEER